MSSNNSRNRSAEEESEEANDEVEVKNSHVHAHLGEKHKRLLNRIAMSHHGGNKTTCLRLALEIYDQWQQQEREQQQWSDEIRKELVEQTELLHSILEGQENIKDNVADLQGDSSLPQSVSTAMVSDAADEIYSTLKGANRPLTVAGLNERTSQPLTVLGEGLESLLDNYIVEEIVRDEDVTRYQIIGENNDN